MTSLRRERKTYQLFAVSWTEALADLKAANTRKDESELYLDFLTKVGTGLKNKIMQDSRFWPIEEIPGTKQVFRKPKSWQEAAYIAKEFCTIDENSRAITDQAYNSSDATYSQSSGKEGNGKGKGGKGEKGKKGEKQQERKEEMPSDQTYVADGVPSDGKGCYHCGRAGHPGNLCPRQAAQKRRKSRHC